MVASSVTIIAPLSGQSFGELRPHTNVEWAGGVGDYDVLYEWDTVNTFDSGALITDTNTAVAASPDEGTPPSDMGGYGTDWYCQVTVTDNDDAGTLTSAINTLVFTNPTDHARYLYLNHNIGVGFGIDSFDGLALGDGLATDFSRYLYLNHNIDTSQQCPWLNTISPTLQVQGGTITLTGDSFGALQSTYTTEIRLYDAQGDHSGSHVVMTATSWSDTEVSVTVPSGASTGWVSVVQTGGTPTCSGSAFFLLNVELVAANPDMGWWIITVDKENQVI